jgi:hypothetical protein
VVAVAVSFIAGRKGSSQHRSSSQGLDVDQRDSLLGYLINDEGG